MDMMHKSTFCILAFLLLSSAHALAQRPPALIPDSMGTVLERLPRGYAALVPLPLDRPPSMKDVQQLLAMAAGTGDARLATRAEGMLARFPSASTDTNVIKARAFSAQHRHDFSSALRLLDRAIELDPRDGNARMARAQVQLVQGRIDLARNDCAALALSIDLSQGMICVAAVSLRTGNPARAIRFLDQWLAQERQDPDFRRHVLVMRAEAAALAGAGDSDAWFQKAVAMAPNDVRTLASYARHLRTTGRPAQSLALLSRAPESDGLQLQRALAAHAAGTPEAGALALAQERRYNTAYAAGGEPELRDAAEFRLTLRGDPAGALKLALRNFEDQRDREDVDILRRSALAAGRPDALAPMEAWAESQGLSKP
jgi:Tfp pilus assembly protein PilF